MREVEWKNQLFLHDRKLYFQLYGKEERVNEDAIEYRIPETVGEVMEVLDMVRQAGGPELSLDLDENDNDWSWVERFKAEKAQEPTDHTHDSDQDTFEALRSQDIPE